MLIPYPKLIEIDEPDDVFEMPVNGHVIRGSVEDHDGVIVRYVASWQDGSPAPNVTFDLMFCRAKLLGFKTPYVAMSLSCNCADGTEWPFWLDASSRPIAKHQSAYCAFPKPSDAPDDALNYILDWSHPVSDLMKNSCNTVDFIISHDTRLSSCFKRIT